MAEESANSIADLLLNIALNDEQIAIRREYVDDNQDLQDLSPRPFLKQMVNSVIAGSNVAIENTREIWRQMVPRLQEKSGELYVQASGASQLSVRFVDAKLSPRDDGYEEFKDQIWLLLSPGNEQPLPDVDACTEGILYSGQGTFDVICQDAFDGRQYWLGHQRR